ncbi:hypothetical protein [uncultured Bilophila sp.]|uniref:hypothetical protein n=1 Tax=uncultured Bilophila sp. TaxID=529385 RepID=UPI00261D12B6|nr:hypothetical protein [uncultured Bilophila sp.]
MSKKFENIESLKPVATIVAEAGAAINDPTRTIETSSIPEILGAGLGASAGAAASFGALWALGTAGLSAAGITSGLATAGALVGGGMVAGIGVLAAPIAILATIGYGIFSSRRHKQLIQAKQYLYEEVIKKHNRILKELENRANLQEDRIEYLQSLLVYLTRARKDLGDDLA